jgi:hypothetical protein
MAASQNSALQQQSSVGSAPGEGSSCNSAQPPHSSPLGQRRFSDKHHLGLDVACYEVSGSCDTPSDSPGSMGNGMVSVCYLFNTMDRIRFHLGLTVKAAYSIPKVHSCFMDTAAAVGMLCTLKLHIPVLTSFLLVTQQCKYCRYPDCWTW